jgi:superfamily II DNA or RNA helicase
MTSAESVTVTEGGLGAGLPPLRGYQIEAVNTIVAGLTVDTRGTVVAACGTGKTVLAAHITHRLVGDGVAAVACPSLALVGQILDEFTRFRIATHLLAVCSDETVADPALHVSELTCPVTTDPERVAAWLRSGSPGGRRIILCTHASSEVLGRGLRLANMAADLLVVDEAHRTAGWAGKQARFLHHDSAVPARRRLYLTATPRVYATSGQGSVGATLSMDDPDTFGRRLYTYPFARAIKEGWLDDYRLVALGVTRQEALTALRAVGATATLEGQNKLVHTAVVQTALARAAVEFGLRRVMVFCSLISDSDRFAITLPQTIRRLADADRPSQPLTSIHIDGGHSHAQRKAALRLLADPPDDGWTVLSNARCLNEGVDVPAVDAVVFAGPKKSEIDIVQAVGRGLRRNRRGTGIATVLVPVLLPDLPTLDDEELGDWDTVCQVIRALKAHDEDLATTLNMLRANAGARHTDPAQFPREGEPSALPPKVILRLPDSHRVHDLLHHISVRILEGSTEHWWAGYGALVRFREEHGHVRVPAQYRSGGVDLYYWLVNRRKEYRQGKLSSDRVEALNRLGVVWAPDRRSWQASFEAAAVFHREHGHLMPTATDQQRVPSGQLLREWLHDQRSVYRRGQLAPERVAKLEELGLVWNPMDQRWQARYNELEAWYRENRDVTPAKKTSLYEWLAEQRDLYSRGRLATERVAALQTLGVDMQPKRTMWEQRLQSARDFQRDHGHLMIPRTWRTASGIALGGWVAAQRKLHRDGRLPAERVAELDKLGMVWNPTDEFEQEGLAQARAYHAEHGNLNVPSLYVSPSGFRLGPWLYRQRKLYQADRLTTEDIDVLDVLGFDWTFGRRRAAGTEPPLGGV